MVISWGSINTNSRLRVWPLIHVDHQVGLCKFVAVTACLYMLSAINKTSDHESCKWIFMANSGFISLDHDKKASIRWQDSVPPISGYWPTSELNAGDHDILLTGSNFGNLTAFRATFSHIFTAHAQERPLMNFWLKFWHHHSIPWSRFPYR